MTTLATSVKDWPRYSLLAAVTYSWLTPLVRRLERAAEGPIDASALFALDRSLSTAVLSERFLDELKRGRERGSPSSSATLFRTLPGPARRLPLWGLPLTALVGLSLLARWLGQYCADVERSDRRIGVALAGSMIALAYLINIGTQAAIANWSAGPLVRATLIGTIGRKASRLSPRARLAFAPGRLLGLMSVDVENVANSVGRLQSLVGYPFQIVAICMSLLVLIGPVALVGIGIIVLSIPFQTLVLRWTGRLRLQVSALTDQRIRHLDQALSSIRLIKLFAWEEHFLGQAQAIRAKELKWHAIRVVCHASCSALVSTTPTFATVATFTLQYRLYAHLSDPASTFASFALFQLLAGPLFSVRRALLDVQSARISVQRIDELMAADEDAPAYPSPSDPCSVMQLKSASFDWPSASLDETPVAALSDITVDIARGQLVMIDGKVGSSKSALARALIGELELVSGSVAVVDSKAYVAQTPSIWGMTLRENVVFGQAYDAERYRSTLEACALDVDIASLPDGDQTRLGERGVTLSGGTKMRVALARALYSDAELMILDDVLSALDAPTGTHIFQHAICGELAHGRTRLLISHQTRFFGRADHLIQLDQGRIVCQGPPAQVATPDAAAMSTSAEPADKTADGDGVVVAEEDWRKSVVSSRVLLDVAKSSGSVWLALTFPLAFVLCTAAQTCAALALAWWAADAFDKGAGAAGFYIRLYVALSAASAIATWLTTASLLSICLLAARQLHDRALTSVFSAPLAFFETTQVGRIVARFSGDVATLDLRLHEQMGVVVETLLPSLMATSIAVLVLPWLAVPALAGIVLGVSSSRAFLPISRALRYSANLERGSTFAGAAELMREITTARTYGQVDVMIARGDAVVDRWTTLEYHRWYLQSWAALRANNGALLVLASVVIAVVWQAATMQPEQAALALAMVINLAFAAGWFVAQCGQLQQDATSIARLQEYCDLPIEEPVRPAVTVDPSWPSGALSFRGATFRYRPELPVALRLTVDVAEGEHLCIVGRTNSGKSSILRALLRFGELDAGVIKLDGVDLASLPLATIRSRIAVLAQDHAAGFSGTFRSTLDPLGEHTDERLNAALRDARLSPKFSLESPIDADASALSQGERALLSLARVLVKDARILILDEPTANLDAATDELVSGIIAERYAQRTVITIAHRLETVLGADRVLVMDAGTMVEIDSPLELYERRGRFHTMCEAAGLGIDDIRKTRAARPRPRCG